MSRSALKLRELLARLKAYGVEPLYDRGKGSEIILIRPDTSGARQGPQYPVKNHGQGTIISPPVIDAILRRFGISKAEFWDLPKKEKPN
jgi:hypothetical protein